MDWVKLGVRYYADTKIAALPDEATELMFVRGLARAGEEQKGGFIPESALPELARRRRYAACADALVAAGLWSRVPGGYQVARWTDWQDGLDALSKRRKADRERQSRRRAAVAGVPAGSQPEVSTPVDNPAILSRDNENMSRDVDQVSRDMSRDVTPPDRDKERDLGGSSRSNTHVAREATLEPPPKCPEHINNEDPPPCGRCGDARRANERWHAEQAERQRQLAALARSTAAKKRAEAHRLAINACHRCDDEGKIGGRPCNHTDPPARRPAHTSIGGLTRERADPVARARQRPEPSGLDAAVADLPPLAQPPPAEDEPETLAEVAPIKPTTEAADVPH